MPNQVDVCEYCPATDCERCEAMETATGLGEGITLSLEEEEDSPENDPRNYDDDLDGDAASALASVGMGTNEDYGDDGDEDA